VPIGMTFLVDVTAFTFMALFIARLGAVNSAAHQIAANVAAVMYMLPLAMGNAVGVLVGQAVGAKNPELARSTGITGVVLVLTLAVLTAIILAISAGQVASFYSLDERVRAVATTLLVFVAGYHVFDALQAVTVSALRAYRRAVVPLLASIAGLWCVGLAGGYVIGLTPAVDLSAFGLKTPLGAPGFWTGAIFGMFVSSIGVLIYFFVVSGGERVRKTRSRSRAINEGT